MQQRGRISAAAASIQNVVALDVTGGSRRLTAPASLNKPEKALFNELVGSCDPRHFVKSDLPLLVSFVQATLLTRQSASKLSTENPKNAAVWERAVRVQALLATRLRLAPQARADPKTIARQQRRAAETGPPPWSKDDDDD